MKKASMNLAKQTVTDIEKQTEIDWTTSSVERLIEDIVTEIQKDKRELLRFSYELLKTDSALQYTREFLYGQVKPSIFVDIIMSNHWSSSAKKMLI